MCARGGQSLIQRRVRPPAQPPTRPVRPVVRLALAGGHHSSRPRPPSSPRWKRPPVVTPVVGNAPLIWVVPAGISPAGLPVLPESPTAPQNTRCIGVRHEPIVATPTLTLHSGPQAERFGCKKSPARALPHSAALRSLPTLGERGCQAMSDRPSLARACIQTSSGDQPSRGQEPRLSRVRSHWGGPKVVGAQVSLRASSYGLETCAYRLSKAATTSRGCRKTDSLGT